jgi:hypothetical protein
MSRRSSWRTSTFSNTAHTDRSYTTIDIGVQTDFDTPATSPSGSNSIRKATMTDIAEHKSEGKQNGMGEEAPKTPDNALPTRQKEETSITNETTAGRNDSLQEAKDLTEEKPQPKESSAIPTIAQPSANEAESDDDEEEEEAVIHTIHQAATPQRAIQARLVSVKKQAPPALPPRNPIRDRKRPLIITADNLHDDDSKDQGTSTMSRDASLSSVYKSEIEETSSGHSLSSVDLSEEMKHDRPLRPSVDESEARTPNPSNRAHSPSPVLRSRSPSPRKSSRNPSPAKNSRTSSPVKHSMPGQF